MSNPLHSCPQCLCPSRGFRELCDECHEDAADDGEDIATADERRRLYSYIGKVRDMHPLAAGEVKP